MCEYAPRCMHLWRLIVLKRKENENSGHRVTLHTLVMVTLEMKSLKYFKRNAVEITASQPQKNKLPLHSIHSIFNSCIYMFAFDQNGCQAQEPSIESVHFNCRAKTFIARRLKFGLFSTHFCYMSEQIKKRKNKFLEVFFGVFLYFAIRTHSRTHRESSLCPFGICVQKSFWNLWFYEWTKSGNAKIWYTKKAMANRQIGSPVGTSRFVQHFAHFNGKMLKWIEILNVNRPIWYFWIF